jgi:hypothetical protein
VPCHTNDRGSLIASCPTHGNCLLRSDGMPWRSPAVPVQQSSESRDLDVPPLWREGRPIPPLQPGEVRAGDAIGQYIRCEPRNRCGCGGVAKVGGSVVKGSFTAGDYVLLECDWSRRQIHKTDPVVLVPKPAEEPSAERPYLRNRPQTLNPIQ